MMPRNHTMLLSCLLVIAPLTSLAQEGQGSDIATAITGGEAAVALRYRYEYVDQDGLPKNANASTLRLRLNYRTGDWRGWSAFGEFDHIFHVLLTDFDSGAGTSPDKAGTYPVVADPKGSDLNQLYVDYGWRPEWKFRFGRQRILLDNERYVGGVGWRQNEQTFDSVSLMTTAVDNAEIFYSYVVQVRRIFGPTVAAGTNDVNAHLLNAKIRLNDNWFVTPYIYYIDNDDISAFSTSTLGARITGDIGVGEGKLAFVGEFATQSDAANAPVNYDADYFHLTGTWLGTGGLSVGIGFESLGGNPDPGAAFRTPLATLHPHNGWADKFLTTPDGGLDDTYLTVKYKAGKWNLTGVYHDFAAETGGGDFGSEFDFSAGRKLTERYGLLLKGALFSADSGSSLTDTNKLWVMLTASY